MYTLLSGLYRHYTRKEEYNVLIVGLDNAGKTTLLEKIKTLFTKKAGLSPDKITPTVGLNVAKVDYKGVKVHFWDLGGQATLRRLWTQYYHECHGVLFVMDSTEIERLEEVNNTLSSLMVNDEFVEFSVPILLLANKQDKEGSLSVERIKETFNQLAVQLEARESSVLPCSAMTGLGVESSVDWIVTRMLLNKDTREPHFSE